MKGRNYTRNSVAEKKRKRKSALDFLDRNGSLQALARSRARFVPRGKVGDALTTPAYALVSTRSQTLGMSVGRLMECFLLK